MRISVKYILLFALTGLMLGRLAVPHVHAWADSPEIGCVDGDAQDGCSSCATFKRLSSPMATGASPVRAATVSGLPPRYVAGERRYHVLLRLSQSRAPPVHIS